MDFKEIEKNMKRVGIYPGNFQPAAIAHYEVYRKLKSLVGGENVFIVTTDREPIPEAPLNFGDKEQIWVRYGVPINHIVKVDSLPFDDPKKVLDWKPEEIYSHFSPQHTATILAVNQKEFQIFSKRKGISSVKDEMSSGLSDKTKEELKEIYEELGKSKDFDDIEKKEVWLDANGNPQYYQPYKGNEHELKSLEEHAYIIEMDDTNIQGKPVSTINIRSVLGSKKYNDEQKKKFFRFVFGWFDQGLYQLMVEKFRYAHQVSVGDDGPITSTAVNLATRINQPQYATPLPKQKIGEIVVQVLKGLVEDYSTTINEPDSSDNLTNMASTLGKEKSYAQKSADMAKQKIELSKKKQASERDLKGLETDLKWKQSDVLRKRKDEIPDKRKELDMLNKQLSSASNNSTTSV